MSAWDTHNDRTDRKQADIDFTGEHQGRESAPLPWRLDDLLIACIGGGVLAWVVLAAAS